MKVKIKEIESDDPYFWDNMHKAGLPMAYFRVIAEKAMKEQLSHNDLMRKYYQR